MSETNDQRWRQRWPDLLVFLEDKVFYTVNSIGATYYQAIDKAWDGHYIEGLSMQLLYISNNLRPKGPHRAKDVEKELVRWSKQLDKELLEERRVQDAQGS